MSQRAGCRVEDVDLAVVPPADPELAPVGGDVAHVGTATARNRPGPDHATRDRIDHADRSLAVWLRLERVPAAIRHVEQSAVPTGIDPVRPSARRDESDL